VLWTRSYLELGIVGTTYRSGSIDRAGHLSFDARLILSNVFEVTPEGTLGGAGQGFSVEKGLYGPTISLVDGRSVQFLESAIRIDSAPPHPDETRVVIFRSLSPTGVDFADIAATSDGGFYAQRASHSALRKYCGDGRLQWELLGIHRADGMMVEADDSVWLPSQLATANRPVHLDATGHVLGHIELPEGGSSEGASVNFVNGTTILHSASADGGNVLVVAQREGSESWRITFPLATFGGLGVDALGGVWIANSGSMARPWDRYVDGIPVARTPSSLDVRAGMGSPAGEDGSFVTMVDDFRDGPQQIGRLLPDGTIAWTLPISEPFQYMTLDVDGRLYLYGSGHVIAVQTDVLPPSVRGCWQHRCSPRGDNRIEPLP
jgi:hypothetical protein